MRLLLSLVALVLLAALAPALSPPVKASTYSPPSDRVHAHGFRR